MKTKRILSVLMVLCMILSVCTVRAYATGNVATRIYENELGEECIDSSFTSLEAAVNACVDGDYVYLDDDYTLSANLDIPSGVTVIIPTDSNLDDDEVGSNVSGAVAPGNPHVTLTIANDATLTVYGTLIVAGNQQSTQPKSGFLTGDYGAIVLNGTLEVYGDLYAKGIISGVGTVIAESGSNVYQLFQISDWRGGTGSFWANIYGVFPFNLYEVKNIQTNVTYKNGSGLTGLVYIYANGNGYRRQVSIIGSNGLLRMNSGYITTSYSSNTLTAIINGAVQTGDISLSISGTTYSSSGLVLPFGYNMDVEISTNSTLTINNEIKLLPGCNIANNGNLVIPSSGALYVYNVADYLPSYNFAGWGGTANATVTGAGNVTHDGTYAQSNSSGSIDVPEFKQSGYTRVYVPFAAVS